MNNFFSFEKVNFMFSKISQTPKKRIENHVFKKNFERFASIFRSENPVCIYFEEIND